MLMPYGCLTPLPPCLLDHLPQGCLGHGYDDLYRGRLLPERVRGALDMRAVRHVAAGSHLTVALTTGGKAFQMGVTGASAGKACPWEGAVLPEQVKGVLAGTHAVAVLMNVPLVLLLVSARAAYSRADALNCSLMHETLASLQAYLVITWRGATKHRLCRPLPFASLPFHSSSRPSRLD